MFVRISGSIRGDILGGYVLSIVLSFGEDIRISGFIRTSGLTRGDEIGLTRGEVVGENAFTILLIIVDIRGGGKAASTVFLLGEEVGISSGNGEDIRISGSEIRISVFRKSVS